MDKFFPSAQDAGHERRTSGGAGKHCMGSPLVRKRREQDSQGFEEELFLQPFTGGVSPPMGWSWDSHERPASFVCKSSTLKKMIAQQILSIYDSRSCRISGAQIYSFELDGTFSGSEICYSQGWPSNMQTWEPGTEEFSSGDLQELGGNAMTLPILTMVTTAFWLNPHAPWWSPRDEDDF